MSSVDRRLRARVEELLIDGDYRPGDRLPTERDLAETLNAARGAVRSVLSALEENGTISRHVGRGTFLERPPRDPAQDGPANTSPAEIMQARLVIEPPIAALAAERATSAHLAELDELVAAAGRARSLAAWERADAALHRGIAVACHNALVLSLFDVVAATRDLPVWGTLKQRVTTTPRRAAYQEQHRAIVVALHDRDPARARSAMTTHLQDVADDLLRGG